MHTLTGKRIQEHRKGSHKSLTFTGSHLCDTVGDLTLVHYTVKHHTTDELNIVMTHIPFHEIASGEPLCLVDRFVAVYCNKIFAGGSQFTVSVGGGHLYRVIVFETTGSFLYNREHLGKSGIEIACIFIKHLFAQIIYLFPERFALVIVESLDLLADLGHLIFIFLSLATDIVADIVYATAKFIIAYIFYLFRDRVDLIVEAIPQRAHRTL